MLHKQHQLKYYYSVLQCNYMSDNPEQAPPASSRLAENPQPPWNVGQECHSCHTFIKRSEVALVSGIILLCLHKVSVVFGTLEELLI